MRKSALWKNEETGESYQELPEEAVAVNRSNNKNESTGIDLKNLLMSGGSGLLAYTMADQILGDNGGEKKKRNAFDRLLSKLIPIGIGGLGAYAGHHFAKAMDGNGAQAVKNASEKSAQNEEKKPPFTYYADANDFGLPMLGVAKPPIKLKGDRPLGFDKDNRPYLVDDNKFSGFMGQDLHGKWHDAMEMSKKTGKSIGECMDIMEGESRNHAFWNYTTAVPLGVASTASWLHGGRLKNMVDSMKAQRSPSVATKILREDLKYRNPTPWRVAGAVGGALTLADVLWGLKNSYEAGRTSTARGYLTGEGRDTVIPADE